MSFYKTELDPDEHGVLFTGETSHLFELGSLVRITIKVVVKRQGQEPSVHYESSVGRLAGLTGQHAIDYAIGLFTFRKLRLYSGEFWIKTLSSKE